jgi:hypothetical protein
VIEYVEKVGRKGQGNIREGDKINGCETAERTRSDAEK